MYWWSLVCLRVVDRLLVPARLLRGVMVLLALSLFCRMVTYYIFTLAELLNVIAVVSRVTILKVQHNPQ
jgi:hypothetical protein